MGRSRVNIHVENTSKQSECSSLLLNVTVSQKRNSNIFLPCLMATLYLKFCSDIFFNSLILFH